MFPIGTSDSGQKPSVHSYPYIIIPVASPNPPMPVGAVLLEALVYSREPHPPKQVLADYCGGKGLETENYRCHAVVFASDLKAGQGWFYMRHRNGQDFTGVDWRDGGKDWF